MRTRIALIALTPRAAAAPPLNQACLAEIGAPDRLIESSYASDRTMFETLTTIASVGQSLQELPLSTNCTAPAATHALRRAGRGIKACAAAVGLAAVLSGAIVSSPAAAQEAATEDVEVRIVARKLDSGRVEFGLQQRQTDDTWGERRLPRVRFFPTTATVDRWLANSTLDLPVGEVRIVARKLDDGRVEFGLQQRQSDDTWGDRQLPRVRFFPTTATVNRWLASSPFTLTAVTCVEVPAHDGDRWCTPPPTGDTIQLFSDWGGLGTDGLTRLRLRRLRPHPVHTTADAPTSTTRGVCRTLPLPLRVGMVIEDYDINGQQYQVHRVTGIGAEPWARNAVWTDVVYPVYLCSRYWRIFPGYEEYGFLPGPDTSEALRIAWRDSDGQWRLLISPARILVRDGC